MKKNNKKGFTLAELLIVVAIIAVLVAVAIPVFGGKLKDAQVATVKANIRAAYAEAAVDVLNDASGATTKTKHFTSPITMTAAEVQALSGLPFDIDSNSGAIKADDTNTAAFTFSTTEATGTTVKIN